MIQLTPLGKQVAENTHGSSPGYSILSLLDESGGSMEVEEIMDAKNLDLDRARMFLGDLRSKGYIKEM